MWKFITRGIRETIERRACRTNVYSQSTQDTNSTNEVKTNLTCNQKILSPDINACNRFCGSTKSSGTKDNQGDSNWDTKHTWSEAVGWSSILAAGWVVCQTLCLHKSIYQREKKETLANRISAASENHLKYIFGQVLNLERKRVLPITHCAGKTASSFTQDDTESQWNADKPFGPLTIEEALKEATEDLAKVHKLAIEQYELHLGLKAVEDKRYKDALAHFTAGAKLSSPASLFNLGVCHELGLGTRIDERKAVVYYTDAAEQGHIDAMYNLGVFYAQGRGGLSIDTDRAHNYFTKAAELGQIQAQHALDLEKDFLEAEDTKESSFSIDIPENSVNCGNHNNSKDILSKLTNYGNTSNARLHIDALAESSSYNQASRDVKSPTDVFLEFLGINEPSLLSVNAVSNSYGVPS